MASAKKSTADQSQASDLCDILADGIVALEASPDHGKVKHNVLACQTARELITVLRAVGTDSDRE